MVAVYSISLLFSSCQIYPWGGGGKGGNFGKYCGGEGLVCWSGTGYIRNIKIKLLFCEYINVGENFVEDRTLFCVLFH